MVNMYFKSDSCAPVNVEILEAIIKANTGNQLSYGDDPYTSKMKAKFAEIFEREVDVYLVSTGTAANALALAALCKSYGSIFSSDVSHVSNDACSAPETFTGGAKVIGLPSKKGKLSVELLEQPIKASFDFCPHNSKPSVISLTQASEFGTLYQIDEITEISKLAKYLGLNVHMDGTRFANAIVSLNCTPAEASWKAGVDVLCLSGTKNGALAAEAILFFNKDLAKEFTFLVKKSGHLVPKMRYFSAQMLAYLEKDLWLENARKANAMATKLAAVFYNTNKAKVAFPVEANEVFVHLDPKLAAYLTKQGAAFYKWGYEQDELYRFVTSFATQDEEIERLANLITDWYEYPS